MLVVLSALAFQLFPSQRVTVFSDGAAVSVGATFDATREGLTGAAVTLEPGDQLLHAGDGSFNTVAVQRAVQTIVQADGATIEVRGNNHTVGGVLASAGIELSPADIVTLDGVVTSTTAHISPIGGDGDGPSIAVHRAKPVTIVVDGIRQDVMSASTSVADLLAELGLSVREIDLVTPPTDTLLTAGMTVRLAPARSMTVTIDQTEGSLYTRAETVADVLAVLGVELTDKDWVSHDLDALVTNGMALVVSLQRVLEEEVNVPIAPRVIYQIDESLDPGQVRYVDGADGVMTQTFSVTYNNGLEVSREEVGSPRIVKSAVPAVVYSGPSAPSGSAGRFRRPPTTDRMLDR